MRHKILIFIVIFFLFMVSVISSHAFFPRRLINKTNPQNEGIIEPITPKDDAFHGIYNQLSNEWWYFDAVYGEDHGVHIGIKVISYGSWGVVKQFINLYNHSEIEEQAELMIPLDHFSISTEVPNIKYRGNDVMIFDQDEYNTSGRWNYTITTQVEHISVNLTFIQKTQGFKYVTPFEGWTVAQPKATVQGTISINDQIIEVDGTGYHDHNWNFSLSTVLRGRGWYWGKITSENYTLTWAKIMKSPFANDSIVQNIAIFSTINSGYEIITPHRIIFTPDEKEFYKGRFIPTEFEIFIQQDDILVNVSLQSVSIHRSPPDFLTIHYYRYFVSVTGYIGRGEQIDYLDDNLQIIEFIRFI